jgi:hypothetical protein
MTSVTPPDDDFVFTDPAADSDPAPGGFSCEVCGDALTYSGRGRHPRFCDEHKPGATRTTKPRAKGLQTLRDDLNQTFVSMGTALCMVDLFDGSVVISRSDALSGSLIALAEKDPKIRKALESAMRAGGYLQLFMVAGTIIGPIAWNHGLLKGIREEETGKVHRNPDLAPVMFKMAGLQPPAPRKQSASSNGE